MLRPVWSSSVCLCIDWIQYFILNQWRYNKTIIDIDKVWSDAPDGRLVDRILLGLSQPSWEYTWQLHNKVDVENTLLRVSATSVYLLCVIEIVPFHICVVFCECFLENNWMHRYNLLKFNPIQHAHFQILSITNLSMDIFFYIRTNCILQIL